METSNKLIQKTKRKFFLYSFIGVLLVSVVSFMALDVHSKSVRKQESIQKMYSMITDQFKLISKISLLSEKFDENTETVNPELYLNFRELINNLDNENRQFNKWLVESDLPATKNMENLLKSHHSKNKMLLYIKVAKELIDNNTLSNAEIKNKINYLSVSSRNGIGDTLTLVSEKLRSEQTESLTRLNRIGFTLIALCILQVILIWLLVFRPLYNTIRTQHEKLVDSILKAESANRSKTDFLANISHEIRTPMTAIMGYADILKRDTISSEEKDDAVKIIDQNASHLLALIDEILDISKIEAGKFDFENEKVNLSTFLNEVYSLINVKADDKGIDLIFKNNGRIPEEIIIDPKRLKQILFNVIGNAIKFTHKGYVELSVSLNEETNILSFHIKDTGIGISEDQVKHLFKPFAQADTSVTRNYGGTGLGLVLSKGLAKGMGGDLKIAESKLGVGTTMEIQLNIGKQEAKDLVTSFSTNIVEEENEIIIKKSDLKDRKILVVDDAKENARLFSLYLKEAGAEVEIANNGQSAIGKAKKHKFDIILLDLQMPGKDGFQVIKELRQQKFNLPIVALTAHAMKEEKEKTKKAGFNDHITKPVKPDFLIESVLKLLN